MLRTSSSQIFKCLLAGVGLADEQVVEFHAHALGPRGVEGVLGVDEGGHAALLLATGDHVEVERGFTARFRAEHFDDTAFGDAEAAQGDIERERAGGDAIDMRPLLAVEFS